MKLECMYLRLASSSCADDGYERILGRSSSHGAGVPDGAQGAQHQATAILSCE